MTVERIQRILVTDAHELAGIGAIRSLGRAGHRVTGLFNPTELQVAAHPAALLPAAWSRYAQQVRHAPNPWTAQDAFAETLLAAARSGEFDVLLPISEAALFATQRIRAQLPPGLVVLMPAAEQLRYTLSKFHLNQAAQRLGVPTPRTAFIGDGEAGSSFDLSGLAALRYPLVVKTDNHLLPSGEYRRGRTLMVHEPAQTTAALAACREEGGAVIVQEHIPGRGSGAFLLRAHGRTVLRFAHRRLHEVPYTGGVSSLRASTHDPATVDLAEHLLAGLGYEGVAMVEFRVDDAGRPFLLEINGRLWGSLALALHAGVDFPLAMLDLATAAAASTAAASTSAATAAPTTISSTSADAAAAAATTVASATAASPATAPPTSATALSDYPDQLRCRNVFPGELHYLQSVLRAPASALTTKDKAAAVAEFLLLFLDPRVRYDYLWWSDPLPGLAQAVATTRYLLAKQLARPRQLLQARRLRAQWAELARRGLAPATHAPQPVLFLCHGNICRSPFAAAYFNQQLQTRALPWPQAQSAGFVPDGGRRTPALLRALSPLWNTPLDDHRSQPVTRELLASAGAIFVMDAANYAELLALDPTAASRTYALGAFRHPDADPRDWQIADPYETSPGKSHAVYQQIVAAIDALLTAWTAPA